VHPRGQQRGLRLPPRRRRQGAPPRRRPDRVHRAPSAILTGDSHGSSRCAASSFDLMTCPCPRRRRYDLESSRSR
jgi:hypothetical protein